MPSLPGCTWMCLALRLMAVSVFLVGVSTPAAAQNRFQDVIVVLNAELAPGGHANNQIVAAQFATNLGLAARRVYGTALFGFSATIPEARLQGLLRDPRVAYVDVDRTFQIPIPRIGAPPWCADNPNHPACSKDDEEGGGGGDSGQIIPWGVHRTGADAVLGGGTGVHVYIIDSGIDSDHPDLQGNLDTAGSRAFVACKGNSRVCQHPWDDDQGHGTHVAGTVAADDNQLGVLGVASDATLHAVKVCAKSGFCAGSDILAGVDWVASQVGAGPPVVANMSLGGGGSKSGTCNAGGFTGTDAYHQALCNAARAGVVFAVAAGNSGADAQNSVPAAYDDAVITVSATECSVTAPDSGGVEDCEPASDDWPSWSNWGDNATAWSNGSAPVALAAPGVSVLSTWNDGGTNTISGTSMATPHVAGAIALYLRKNPGQAADYSAFTNVRTALLAAAEETGGVFDNTSSHPHAEEFVDAEAFK